MDAPHAAGSARLVGSAGWDGIARRARGSAAPTASPRQREHTGVGIFTVADACAWAFHRVVVSPWRRMVEMCNTCAYFQNASRFLIERRAFALVGVGRVPTC